MNPTPSSASRADTALANLTLRDITRALLPTTLAVIVVGLFVWMVHDVLVAAMLGAITALYAAPIHRRLTRALRRRRTLAAVLTLVAVLGPLCAITIYSYAEIHEASEQIHAQRDYIASRLDTELNRTTWLSDVSIHSELKRLLRSVSGLVLELPEAIKETIAETSIAAVIYVATAFYILRDGAVVRGYVRSRIPERYREFAAKVAESVKGVLFGTVYGVLVGQTLKAVTVYVAALALGVPLAGLLGLLSFVVGFFPIVGSWTIYVPAAAYLWLFQQSPIKAILMLAVGFAVNTLLISLVLRPRLASERSQILNAYWMLVGLITGVYTFGLPGLVLGPILIGLLKVILDFVVRPDAPALRLASR